MSASILPNLSYQILLLEIWNPFVPLTSLISRYCILLDETETREAVDKLPENPTKDLLFSWSKVNHHPIHSGYRVGQPSHRAAIQSRSLTRVHLHYKSQYMACCFMYNLNTERIVIVILILRCNKI